MKPRTCGLLGIFRTAAEGRSESEVEQGNHPRSLWLLGQLKLILLRCPDYTYRSAGALQDY